MNLRPSGYEPDELPGCSTPRHHVGLSVARKRLLCVHLDGVDLDGGLLHPASPSWAECSPWGVFVRDAKRAKPVSWCDPLVWALLVRGAPFVL